MSNNYEPESIETPVEREKLTWAEWSIIVALFCIVVSFLYGWHVQAVAADTKAKLARYNAMLKACEEILGKPVTDPKDIKETLDKLAGAEQSAREWNEYADTVLIILGEELDTYWRTSKAREVLEKLQQISRPQPRNP
ncbi:MAG: hypothetical protein LBU65_06090 [Planctomycetaceae bacterium]|jgi:hypothetical protein|nr:hypothetical protein [Planctomycetaceae bacterium]